MLLFHILIKILLLYLELCALPYLYRVLLGLFYKRVTLDSYLTIYKALAEGYYVPNSPSMKAWLNPGSVNFHFKQKINTSYSAIKISSVYKAWQRYWKNEFYNSLYMVANTFYLVADVAVLISSLKKNIKAPK